VLDESECAALAPPVRDGADALDAEGTPAIVSVSDIHGHLAEARSALLTLADHPDYRPVVEADPARRLNWAGGEEYVLVFNGDLIDRGPHSAATIEMAQRLARQAPPGHVRVTVGNHEMCLLTPDIYRWDTWYSGQRDETERRRVLDAIADGYLTAAYDGYNFTYSHAGRTEPFDVTEINGNLTAAATELAAAIGTADYDETQDAVTESYPEVFGFDGETGRGPGAGIAWLDFEHMPTDAPPQIVGHTIQSSPTRVGDVICENVIRKNRRDDGGEAALVETPDRLVALGRDEDENAQERELPLPD